MLTLQIKILMMKILWMVTDLPLPVLHLPKLHQAHGETLEWGPPGGLDHPLLGLSLPVIPSPGGGVGSAVQAFETRRAWFLPSGSFRSEAVLLTVSLLAILIFCAVSVRSWRHGSLRCCCHLLVSRACSRVKPTPREA